MLRLLFADDRGVARPCFVTRYGAMVDWSTRSSS